MAKQQRNWTEAQTRCLKDEQRLPVAESFEIYHSIRERKYPYYRIYVKNYVIWYVVIDDEGEDKIMEVRRFLYNKQNQNKLITCKGDIL